jgi:DNA-binding NarL/FixJ family response regulator
VEPLRILIVDDHPMFRFGLHTMLDALAGLDVVGEAATGREAIGAAEQLRPDVVIMDLHLPDLNGVEVTRRVVRSNPQAAVLVLTMFYDDESIFAAMRAGAHGYLLKGADQSDIARAVHAVGRGEAIFGPAIASRVLRYFGRPLPSSAGPLPELTVREREILDLIARGQTNMAIANRLVLSPKTVRNHVSNIFSKLRVADRAQAISLAQEAGLGNRAMGRDTWDLRSHDIGTVETGG